MEPYQRHHCQGLHQTSGDVEENRTVPLDDFLKRLDDTILYQHAVLLLRFRQSNLQIYIAMNSVFPTSENGTPSQRWRVAPVQFGGHAPWSPWQCEKCVYIYITWWYMMHDTKQGRPCCNVHHLHLKLPGSINQATKLKLQPCFDPISLEESLSLNALGPKWPGGWKHISMTVLFKLTRNFKTQMDTNGMIS